MLFLGSICLQWNYGSSAAGDDFRQALEDIHGAQGGTYLNETGGSPRCYEELTCFIQQARPLAPESWLAIRLEQPYKYRCEVVYARTLLVEQTARQIWTYDGWDDPEPNSRREVWIGPDSVVVSYPDGQTLFE